MGIILLLPLGLHMGFLWGIHPWGGWALVELWALFRVLEATENGAAERECTEETLTRSIRGGPTASSGSDLRRCWRAAAGCSRSPAY